MAKLGIGTGIVPDDGTGDSLLDGAVKINSNFSEIYTYFGDGTNLTFTGGGVSSQWVTTGVGIHTLSNVGIGTTNPRFKLEVGAVGASGTTLFVNGDARVTGIVTIGPASITLNGISNIINVGSGITINGSTGAINATSINLGGTTLTGAAVTSITAGSGISVNSSTGNVTITATGGGGGEESYWVETSAGIHTLSNVGIGTTNPTSKLTVSGDISASSLRGYNALVGTASSTITSFTVTVVSKSPNHRYFGTGSALGYHIDGIESPFLTLLPGKTYRFTQDDGSNSTHQLLFYYEANRTTQYTTNVTTNGTAGSAGAYTEIVVTDTTPVVLHYQCINHGYMGNAAQFNSNVVDTSYQITARSGINVTGVATATTFSGSGSGLTNIPSNQLSGALPALDGSALIGLVGVGTGVEIQENGSPVGTAVTINFGTNLDVSFAGGVATVDATGGGGSSQFVTTAAGIHTLSNVGIGTTNPTEKLTVSGNAVITGITTHLDKISFRTSLISNEFASLSNVGKLVLGDGTSTVAGIDIINNTTSASAEIFTISTPNVNLYGKKIVVDYGGRLLLGGNLTSSINNALTIIDNSGNISLSGYVSAGGTIGASTIFTNQLSVSGVATATSFVGSLTGTATSTTNIPNLTGDITSTGTATAIAAGVIVNADINASAGIVDTKLDTISTAGKVSNSATTATSANTNSAIVARDGSGNFSAGTITATTFSGSGSGLTNIPASSITFTISASGSSYYIFSGPGIVSGNTNDPILYLYKGFTYTFINTTGGSHPFAIRVSAGGASYTPGVSGSTTGTQTFIVPMNAPSTLYYQCTIHSGMGNVINIV